jgi:hypothetical protein
VSPTKSSTRYRKTSTVYGNRTEADVEVDEVGWAGVVVPEAEVSIEVRTVSPSTVFTLAAY